MDFAVRVSGGRTLAVRDAGDPARMPVLVQSGTPGSRYLYGPNVEDARLRGLRMPWPARRCCRSVTSVLAVSTNLSA